jgi:hypothetical protein
MAFNWNRPNSPARVIAALYASEERMPLSGEVLIGAELVESLGVFDIDVRQPPSHRQTLADAPRIPQNPKAVSCRNAFNLAAYLQERHGIRDPTLTIICGAGFRKAASRPRFHSGPEACGALTNLFQYRFKISHFFLARISKDFSNFGTVLAKNRRDQSFPF